MELCFHSIDFLCFAILCFFFHNHLHGLYTFIFHLWFNTFVLSIKFFMNDWSSSKTLFDRLNMLILSKESYIRYSTIGLRHYNIEIVMFWQEIFEK
jgi:hypothetical protein